MVSDIWLGLTKLQTRHKSEAFLMDKQWIIKSGPSKFDFIDALSHRKHSVDFEVEFTIQKEPGDESETRRIKIFLISKKSCREEEYSSDPQLWGFLGDMEGRRRPSGHSSTKSYTVVGEYSTKTRTGTIIQEPYGSNKFWQRLRDMNLL